MSPAQYSYWPGAIPMRWGVGRGSGGGRELDGCSEISDYPAPRKLSPSLPGSVHTPLASARASLACQGVCLRTLRL